MNIKLTINNEEINGYWNNKIYYSKNGKYSIYLNQIQYQVDDKTREYLKSLQLQNEKTTSNNVFEIEGNYNMYDVVRSTQNSLGTVIKTRIENGIQINTCDKNRLFKQHVEKFLRSEIENLRMKNNNTYQIPSFYEFNGRYIHINNKCWYECFSFEGINIYAIFENMSFNKISEIFLHEQNVRDYLDFKYGDGNYMKIQ